MILDADVQRKRRRRQQQLFALECDVPLVGFDVIRAVVLAGDPQTLAHPHLSLPEGGHECVGKGP